MLSSKLLAYTRAISLVCVAVAAVPAQAQSNADSLPAPRNQIHRDFGFPGSVRPWERFMHLGPRPGLRNTGRHGWHHRTPSGYLGMHGPWGACRTSSAGCGSHCCTQPSCGQTHAYTQHIYTDPRGGGTNQYYSIPIKRAYDLGVAPSQIQNQLEANAQLALSEYRDVMKAGHAAFQRGRFQQAVRYYLLATELNQGDPTSRLCAAHAQTAIGRYKSASAFVRRAFDLQTKLVYIEIDIKGAYTQPELFDKHLNALHEAAKTNDDPETWFLLGYYLYNSGKVDAAGLALNRASSLASRDRIINRFASVVSKMTP